MFRSILALAFSAALLALGVPQIRERLTNLAKDFAICRVGWDVSLHHDPFAMVNIVDSATTYQKFCARCNATLATGPIPPEEQAVVDKVMQMLANPPALDMGLPVIEQRGFMN